MSPPAAQVTASTAASARTWPSAQATTVSGTAGSVLPFQAIWVIQAAMSCMERSMNCPRFVRSRYSNAASTATRAISAPNRSTMEIPVFMGMPSSRTTSMMPDIACTTLS